MSFFQFNNFSVPVRTSIISVLIYLAWISAHYVSAHTYAYFCAPSSVMGFLMSPFMVPMPHCTAIRWTIDASAMAINNMWFLLGSWAIMTIASVCQNAK